MMTRHLIQVGKGSKRAKKQEVAMKQFLSMLGLLFLCTMCKPEKDHVRRITHSFIPPYKAGDTLGFSSDSGLAWYRIRENTKKVVQAEPISGAYLFEEVYIILDKIGDTRKYPGYEFYAVYIDNELITFMWNGCPQQDVFQQLDRLTLVNQNGRTYNKVLEKSALCWDSLNPMRLTYDLDSGIIGYVDSSHVRWTLVPK